MSRTSHRTQLHLVIQAVKHHSRNVKAERSIPNRGQVEISSHPLVVIRRIILIN